MAYRRSRGRSYTRGRSGRSSYSRGRSFSRRRVRQGGSRRFGGAGRQTVRLVIQQAPQAVPSDMGLLTAAPAPRRARF